MEDEIIINKDALFKLIKEKQELRDIMEITDENDLIKKHDIKVEIRVLETILKDDGIDIWLGKIMEAKNSIATRRAIVESEQNGNE